MTVCAAATGVCVEYLYIYGFDLSVTISVFALVVNGAAMILNYFTLKNND